MHLNVLEEKSTLIREVAIFSSLLCRISEWNASGTRTNVGGAWLCSWGIDWMVVVCYWL